MSGRLTVVDVGQGDGLILHHSDRATAAIVDCAFSGAVVMARYLRDERVQRLLGVIVTHLDDDHYAGVPQLLRTLQPRPATLAYGITKGFRHAHPQVATFLTQMDAYDRRHGVDYLRPEDGKVLGTAADGIIIEFLGPTANEDRRAQRLNDANAASAIIRATVGDLTAILPGDAPPCRWQRLASQQPALLNADVLVMPHHGAAHGGGPPALEQLLDLVRPKVIAVSVGSRNRYGHPDLRTLGEAGAWARAHDARLICTQLNAGCGEAAAKSGGLSAHTTCAGTITIEHDGSAVRVGARRQSHRAHVTTLADPRCAPVPREAP